MIPWIWFFCLTVGYCSLLKNIKSDGAFAFMVACYLTFSMSMVYGILANIR